jgi:hypothetical protein
LLTPIRDTLREAIQLEDYEEGGQVTVSSLRDALEGLQIDGLEGELLDFAVFWGYSRGGEDLQAVRYQVLLDAVDGQAGKGTGGEGRKRPESSSPAQLKARNKEKYSLEGSGGNAKGGKEEQSPEGAAEEEEDYKEEQFEQMLDKDDDEAGGDESAEKSPSSQRKKDEFIDEDKMLDIAEKCFMRIAEAIIT